MSDSADFELILVDGYTKEARRAARATRELERYMRSLQRQQEKDYRIREKGLNLTHRSGREFARTARSAAGAAAKIALVGGALAATAAVMAGIEIAERISETESSVFALEKLTHNGAQAFGEMRGMAKELGLDIDKTAHSYADFLKLQFPQSEAKKLMTLGADMQALGNSADDVQGIFRALGQIKSKGRLQGDEMLQLAERGVSQGLIYKALAQGRGLEGGQAGVDKIRKLQEAGEIGADEFMVAFEKAVNKKLGQAKAGDSAKDFVKSTFSGAKGQAQAEMTDLFIVASTAAQPGLKAGLQSFTEMIQVMSSDENMGRLERVMEGVGTAFEVTGEIVGYLIPKVVEAADVFGGAFTDGYNSMGGEAMTANGALSSTKELIDLLIPIARDLGNALGAIAASMQWLSAHSPDLDTFTNGFKTVTSLTSGDVGGAFSSISDLFASDQVPEAKAPTVLDEDSLAARRAVEVDTMTDHGKNWGEGFISGIKSREGDAYYAASSLAAAAEAGARDKSETHSPSRVAERIGDDWVAGFNNPLLDAQPSMALPTVTGRAGAFGGGMNITIERGAIPINISGSEPEQTAQAALRQLERDLGSIFTRAAMEAGA